MRRFWTCSQPATGSGLARREGGPAPPRPAPQQPHLQRLGGLVQVEHPLWRAVQQLDELLGQQAQAGVVAAAPCAARGARGRGSGGPLTRSTHTPPPAAAAALGLASAAPANAPHLWDCQSIHWAPWTGTGYWPQRAGCGALALEQRPPPSPSGPPSPAPSAGGTVVDLLCSAGSLPCGGGSFPSASKALVSPTLLGSLVGVLAALRSLHRHPESKVSSPQA